MTLDTSVQLSTLLKENVFVKTEKITYDSNIATYPECYNSAAHPTI